LKRETDPNSRERMEAVEREVATLREQITALRARWTREREAINRISELKKRIEALRFEAEDQTRRASSTGPRRSSMANCPSWRRSLRS